MPSINQRRFREAIVKAELAGQSWFWGAPCKKNPEHINEDGCSKRDTVKRSCLGCDIRVKEFDVGVKS